MLTCNQLNRPVVVGKKHYYVRSDNKTIITTEL